MKFSESVYDALFKPAIAMRQIAAEKNLKHSFAVFLLSMAVSLGTLFYGLKLTHMDGMMPVFVFGQIAVGLFQWFLGTAVLALTSELFGGSGSALGLFAARGYTHLPRLFLPVFSLLTIAAGAGGRVFCLSISGLLLFGWTFYLDFQAIKGAYALSGAKAMLVMLFPLLAAGAFAAILFILMGAWLASWLPGHLL